MKNHSILHRRVIVMLCFFFSPENTLKTVFWSLFGRGESTVVELTAFEHYVTETIGYWMFGVYNIATVIVLLNMLIAMMSRSFEIIQVISIACTPFFCRRHNVIVHSAVYILFGSF